MDITVKPDRILIGTEFVPRFLDLPRVLAVAEGQTVTLDPDSTWDYIENAGTLRSDPTRNTIVHATHLFNLPTGHLELGADATHRFELVFRDVLIDKARDPFQWGNGLLNFGEQLRIGATKTSRVIASGDLFPGATTIQLESAPVGWQIGDELLIPETKQQPVHFDLVRPRREKPVFVAAINGPTITLSKPLDFEHLQVRKPDGSVVVKPRILNVTRNVLLRSENALGTPGHTANVGHNACWDLRANQLVSLGRTSILPIDSTSADLSHIGTNQVGRYTEHNHHAQHHGHDHLLPCEAVNNVYRGRGNTGSKWAQVTHGTHDTTIEDCIAFDFPGAAFVTEDGYEVRNRYVRNTAAYILAPNYYRPDGVQEFFPPTNITELHPGTEGTGYWMRGVKNYYDQNEGWDCTIGINLMNQAQLPGMYPSVPNGPLDVVFDALHNAQQKMAPVQFTDNLMAGNLTGIDLWSLPPFDNLRSVCVNNVAAAVNAQISESHRPILKQPLFVNQLGDGFGINADGAYLEHIRVEGGYVGGFESGLPKAGAVEAVELIGTVFQNVQNLAFTNNPQALLHENVTHVPYQNYPAQYIVLHDGAVWNGTSANHSSELGFFAMSPTRGSQYRVKNWQGTGKDYRLFQNQQHAELPAWGSAVFGFDQFNPPEDGLTMAQSWAKYGIAFRGDTVPLAQVVHLEGLVNGFAADGLQSTLGAPQAVITFPTMRVPAALEYEEYFRFYGVVSGDPTQADGRMKVVIDGTTTFILEQDLHVGPLDGRRFALTKTQHAQHMTPGTHEVKTWRYDPAGAILPTSERVFHYFFGDAPPPLPTKTVPNVVGQTQVAASAAIVAAGLVVGGITTQVNAAPLGQVIAQTPAAGATVNVGSFVALVVSSGPTPVPVETWVAQPTARVERLSIDGVPQDSWRICDGTSPCREVVFKP